MSADILIVDDEIDIRTLISRILVDEGYTTRQASNSAEAIDEIRTKAPAVVLLDIWLVGSTIDGMELLKSIRRLRPKTQVIMISGHGTIETAVKAIKMGAYDFLEKPFQSDRLLLMIQRSIEAANLKQENQQLRLRADGPEELIGRCNSIAVLRRTIERASPTGSRVLITGPAGSGKETVARLIHRYSLRKDAPFIVVSCAALQPEDIQTRLFGTTTHPISEGYFEQADGGTLLLDEVADMPLETQGKIIRILQDKRFERGNGQDSISIDVRVIATTNRDLKKEISEGRFREELFYRLAVVPVTVPSLADRREDIPEIAKCFMKLSARKAGVPARELAEDTIAALQSYPWPGNARQLKNIIDWLLIMAPGNINEAIRSDMLPADLSNGNLQMLQLKQSNEIMMLPLREARVMFEREYLMSQVIKHGGNISRTSEFVGMERSALHRKLKSLGVADQVKARREEADIYAPNGEPDSQGDI